MNEKQIENIFTKWSLEAQVELRDKLIEKFPLPIQSKTQSKAPKAEYNYSRTEKEILLDKFPKQEKVCLDSLNETMNLTVWGAACLKSGLVTKQDPTRIIVYYLKDLVDRGFVAKEEIKVA